jgi:hypothetical protein
MSHPVDMKTFLEQYYPAILPLFMVLWIGILVMAMRADPSLPAARAKYRIMQADASLIQDKRTHVLSRNSKVKSGKAHYDFVLDAQYLTGTVHEESAGILMANGWTEVISQRYAHAAGPFFKEAIFFCKESIFLELVPRTGQGGVKTVFVGFQYDFDSRAEECPLPPTNHSKA